MSWILINKKKLAVCLVALFSLIIMFTSFWCLSVLGLCAIVLFAIEHRLKKYNAKSLALMHQRKDVVRIDTLVIGDTCEENVIEKYKIGNTLQIQLPDRSLDASYQIFMHVESILAENGKLVIISDSKAYQNGFSVYDVQFLSTITRKELGVEGLVNKFRHPLINSPILSLKILMGYKKKHYQETKCPKKDLIDFCCERGIDFIYLNR